MTISSIFESLSSSPQVASVEVAAPGVIFRFENGCRLEIHECYWSFRCHLRVNEEGEIKPYFKVLATSHDQQGVKENALKSVLGLPIAEFIDCSFDPSNSAARDRKEQSKASTGETSITFSSLQRVELTLEVDDTVMAILNLYPLKSHESVNWVFVDEAGGKTTSTQFHGLERIE
jgi:hypothetical protein